MKTKILFLAILFYSGNLFSQNSAPDFEGTDVRGNKVKLSELTDKLVYLDFWASWCKPCKESFPFMVDMHDKYSDAGLEIIAINVDSDEKKMKIFLDEFKGEISFSILFDEENKIIESYKIENLPTSFFIHDGKIISTHVGFKKNDMIKIESEIQELLKMLNE